jgi:hypothetical protein
MRASTRRQHNHPSFLPMLVDRRILAETAAAGATVVEAVSKQQRLDDKRQDVPSLCWWSLRRCPEELSREDGMKRCIVSVLMLWMLLVPATGEAVQRHSFKGDAISIDLFTSGDAITGTVHFKGADYPLMGKRVGDTINGTFQSGASVFEFTCTLAAEQLTFRSGGGAYELKRVVTNPLDEGGSTRVGEASSSDPTRGWKTFKHPTGVMLKYPSDWTTQEQPGALQLIPPDPAKNEQGPAEAYLIAATSAEGIASASDPRVVQAVEGQIAQFAPFLKSTGKSESVRAVKTDGILQNFEGTNPFGRQIRAQVYTTILKGYAISMMAIGETSVLSRREAIARGVFTTISDTEVQIDPALVGKWHYWTYSSSSDGKLSSEHDYHLALLPDGSAILNHRGQTSGSVSVKDSGGNETANAGWAGDRTTGDKGKWSAGGGKIYLQWDDGSASAYEYSVSGGPGGRKVIARAGQGAKAVEWMEE